LVDVTDEHGDDPTERSRWRPVRLLLAALDDEIATVYADAAIEGLRPNWAMELIRLHRRGPMTIAELARSVQVTHSGESQKVAAMRAAGLVRTVPGPDARSKRVTLTAKATRLVDRITAEWEATEAAIEDLEGELPYPLSRVVADIQEALARKSFHDRIRDRLDRDPRWG
jgi:DNA-binding MarR family transcriptional regulator